MWPLFSPMYIDTHFTHHSTSFLGGYFGIVSTPSQTICSRFKAIEPASRASARFVFKVCSVDSKMIPEPRRCFWHSIDVSRDQIRYASYTRAFGDGPRNFEPWSSDVDDTLAPPLLTTTPHQREDVSALDRFNVHRCPTRRVFSGTRLELVTRQATIRYLYHSATAACNFGKERDMNFA
ncbi:uncharacterized protein TNCV_3253111 [Trichonephila clavipes]|nr:uncharacterized protein TNCV_3253111 [Trichonephila clavipes]